MQKLNLILKHVSGKIKNLILDNFLEINEVNLSINPFYSAE